MQVLIPQITNYFLHTNIKLDNCFAACILFNYIEPNLLLEILAKNHFIG